MNLEIVTTDSSQKKTIWNLFQLYCYDSTDWDPEDVGVSGFYALDDGYFSQYWTVPGWSAHILKMANNIVGFLLIERSDVPGVNAPEFADLFILKKYRRQGIGKEVVQRVVVTSGQPWVITVFDDDTAAKAFWSNVFKQFDLSPIRELRDPHGRAAKVYLLNDRPRDGL